MEYGIMPCGVKKKKKQKNKIIKKPKTPICRPGLFASAERTPYLPIEVLRTEKNPQKSSKSKKPLKSAQGNEEMSQEGLKVAVYQIPFMSAESLKTSFYQ